MEEQKNQRKIHDLMKHQFTLFSFFLFTLLGYSQEIKVDGLKIQYKKGENITFIISNKSDSVLYLSSFILEKFNKGDAEWYEQVYDILNNNCSEFSGKEGFVLAVDSIKQICWNPKKVNSNCFSYKDNFGKYRVVFKYDVGINTKEKFYYKEFIITK
jgi:hypothetical protein